MAARNTLRAAWRCRVAAISGACLCVLWACAGGREGREASATVAYEPWLDAGASSAEASHKSSPAAESLSEAAARALLAERFRAAGLRVRYDVLVAREGAFSLTVDGYDPARRVGFEYVATAERDTDIDAAERAALSNDPEERILVMDASDVAALEAVAERFLHGLEARE